MCRMFCFMGTNPLQLAELVTRPKRSILTQSYDARERQPHTVEHLTKSSLNGDGFGVGWYSAASTPDRVDEKPCVYTSVLPAWNNNNLARLAEKVESPLVFAHVRAAYPGMPVSDQNCHPFVFGNYMFMHNGNVGDFYKVRRRLLAGLSLEAYNSCQSFHSDSAVCFAVFLNQLSDMHADLNSIELSQKMNETLRIISEASEAEGCEERSLMNFVVSDGKTVIATKFASSGNCASLYMAAGSTFVSPRTDENGTDNPESDTELLRCGKRTKIAIIASEPITASDSMWTKVPENHMVVLMREKDDDVNVTFMPIDLHKTSEFEQDRGQAFRALESVSSGTNLYEMLKGRIASTTSTDIPSKKMPDDILTGHKGPVLSVVMDSKSRMMYTGGVDALIGVWNMDSLSGKLQKFIKGHHHCPVIGLSVSQNYILSIGGNWLVVYNKCNHEIVQEKSMNVPNAGLLLSMCLTPKYLFLAGQDACFRSTPLHSDSNNGDWVLHKRGHSSFVNAMVMYADYLCTGGADTVVKIWDVDPSSGGKTKAVLRGHTGEVLSLATAVKLHLLISGSRDNTMRVWDMEVLCCRRTISGHQNDVVGIACFLSRGEDLLCSVSLDSTCKVWDLQTGQCVRCMSLDNLPSSCGIFDSSIYIGSDEGEITEWSIENAGRGLERSRAGSEMDSSSYSEFLHPGETMDSSDNLSEPKPANGKVQSNQDAFLVETLREFIALKSISGDDAYREDCFKAAKFVTRLLERCGAMTKMIHQENKNPAVLARFEADSSKPTITFYGHYDVQPALEQTWRFDPFEMRTMDGSFYGRGTTDNKGPILAFIFAVKELIAECGGIARLPLNIALVIEGEEENGSKGFKETLESNTHWFQNTKLIVISNTLWIGQDRPCITYGMRGMITMSVEVLGPRKDLHSGNEGGVFNEPMTDLMKVLASMQDSSNNVLIPGFYDGIDYDRVEEQKEMLESLSHNLMDVDKYAESLGLPSLNSGNTVDCLSKKWLLPTLSIVEVRTHTKHDKDAHYCFGPTRFSVIPHRAIGHFSIRFVASQNPHDLVESVTKHVMSVFAQFNSHNKIKLTIHNIGEAWEGNGSHLVYDAAIKAVEKCWGESPLYTFEGGTMPVTSTLEKVLDAPALLIPLGQSTDNPHLANERIRSTNLFKGKRVMKTLIEEVNKLAS